jgi:hypothetical protein
MASHVIFVPVPTDPQRLRFSYEGCTSPGRIKFHQHADIYMGRIPSPYYADNGRILSTYASSESSLLFLLHST